MSKILIQTQQEVHKPYNELTDEEKCIYHSGKKKGFEEGQLMTIVGIIMLVMLMITIYLAGVFFS